MFQENLTKFTIFSTVHVHTLQKATVNKLLEDGEGNTIARSIHVKILKRDPVIMAYENTNGTMTKVFHVVVADQSDTTIIKVFKPEYFEVVPEGR